jgi:type IV pilus assembly protein PilO
MAPPKAAARPQEQGSALDRLSPVGKMGLAFLFLALFGALYFVMFFGEIDAAIASEQQKESARQDELQRAKTSQEAYQKDLDEKTRREQLAREQKKILPDEAETPAFLSGLQGVATISGVNLTGWKPKEETRQEFFAKVPMELNLSGKFHQVAKFFHGVGQLDRIINIEDIKIKQATSKTAKLGGEEGEIEVNCLATAFRSAKAGEPAEAGRRRGGQK